MAPRSRKAILPHFNVMVVGFSGVGKTSFVRTLVESLKLTMTTEKRDSMFQPSSPMSPSSPLSPSSRGSNSVGDDLSLIQGPLERTLVPYTVSVDAQVDNEKMVLTLIDTPGFQSNHYVDKQLHDILGYIEHQFDLTLAEENKVKRNTKAVDSQVHALLYFVDPRKVDLDEYDVRALSKLSKRVNVIPVIGKSDTLTLAQRNRLKATVVKSIYNVHKIPLYGIPDDEDDEQDDDEHDYATTLNGDNVNGLNSKGDTKMANDVDQKDSPSLDEFLQQFDYEQEDDDVQAVIDYLRMIPFTFIACEEDPITGKPLQLTSSSADGNNKALIPLGRDYGWGTIDCLSDTYSDFGKLKTVLLGSHRRILMADTVERYYEQYRTERLLQKRATKMKSMVASKKILEDLTRL
ncbi:Septin-domain-containing protein [Absidia repens]|uniref:Septin-domain-containing protein n=1 Tax=Absidia repens TaxID=90262 RepID=A0A1X2IWR7_9FUNG|nr:Septin-domain-containing protein [Absidia repens]